MSGFADKSDGSSSTGEIDTLCDPDLKIILLGDRFSSLLLSGQLNIFNIFNIFTSYNNFKISYFQSA